MTAEWEDCMIYRDFKDKKLSLLGFGAMRLPQNADGSVNEELVADMVKHAMNHGVNYYDTAYPYHNGESERVMGRVLSAYPRDSYYLATKYPGHQISATYDPKAVFEDQLKKCGVEYFDFYLLHNVYENSIKTYTDPQWGIMDYFLEQKRLGKIKHLGFSTHGGLDVMKEFLELYGKEMEFCQIQMNYLDWTLQNAKAKYELLAEYEIPVWIMEPVRGGRLAKLDEESEARMKEMRPDESVAAWCFRYLQGFDKIGMILSGMSDMAQMKDNVKTFEAEKPLTDEEQQFLTAIAEGMKKAVPCTACRYCVEGCPMKLDIPMLLAIYNDLKFTPSTNVSMRIEALPEHKKPSVCVGCGKCTRICPQKIDIPQAMKDFEVELGKLPSWEDVSREREEAQKKNAEKYAE